MIWWRYPYLVVCKYLTPTYRLRTSWVTAVISHIHSKEMCTDVGGWFNLSDAWENHLQPHKIIGKWKENLHVGADNLKKLYTVGPWLSG